MQVTRDLQVQGLLHDEKIVRDTLLQVLAGQSYSGPDAARSALIAIGKWGMAEAFEHPHQICDLALDDSCFESVLNGLEDLADGNHLSTKIQYGGWLAGADVPLLEKYWERFSRTMRASGDSPEAKRLERILANARTRLEIRTLPREARWKRLDQILETCVGENVDFPHAKVRAAEICCEALIADGRADAVLQERVKEWLDFDFNKEEFEIGHWRAGIAIRLAGMAGIGETVPRLLQMFDHDWDWWNEEIQTALESIGTMDALRVVADAYPDLAWHARLYLSGLFENVWVEGMDEVIYPLLEWESDEGNMWNFGWALAAYGSARSMETAAAFADADPTDPEAVEIMQLLYSHHAILGLDRPEMKKWRERIDDAEKRRKLHQQQFAALLSGAAKAPQPQATVKILQPENAPEPPSEVPGRIVPIRTKPKVGRNEPCPCGSGKKHKKCCLT